MFVYHMLTLYVECNDRPSRAGHGFAPRNPLDLAHFAGGQIPLRALSFRLEVNLEVVSAWSFSKGSHPK